MRDIYELLARESIEFEKFEHPAVFTCEEAESVLHTLPGIPTKNLFLRDRKGERHLLVVVGYEKAIDLKRLRILLGVDKLSFASPERLKKYLGVEPGSATLLGLISDHDHAVEVIIDEIIWGAEAIHCHPLTNAATLVIPHQGIEKFLKATGHSYKVLRVPARS